MGFRSWGLGLGVWSSGMGACGIGVRRALVISSPYKDNGGYGD